jgi:hypothetical protein
VAVNKPIVSTATLVSFKRFIASFTSLNIPIRGTLGTLGG